jgi:predicted RNA-binding Zn-ribbon protein involved in translation (DUF1610 family)
VNPLEWFANLFGVILLVAIVGFLLAPLGWLGYVLLRKPRTHKQPESESPSATCTNCGYDLRASPERCPECGTVPRFVRLRRLREARPTEAVAMRRPDAQETQAVAYETDDVLRAGLLKEHLEVRGIRCEMTVDDTPRAIGMRRLANHKLLVWSNDLLRAQETIDFLLGADLQSAEVTD